MHLLKALIMAVMLINQAAQEVVKLMSYYPTEYTDMVNVILTIVWYN